MKYQSKYEEKRKSFPLVSKVGLLILTLLLAFNGYTLAKYLTESREENLYVARAFYFESDLLAAPASNGTYPSHTLRSGVDSITVMLKNYPDELRVSEVDIEYTVTLTKAGRSTAVDEKTGTLTISEKEELVSFEDLEPGNYCLTAVSNMPYTTTLKADFTVVGVDESFRFTVSDAAGSPVLYLTITTEDYEGIVNVGWPAGILPDNTDAMLTGVSGNGCRVALKAHAEYTFPFFKSNPATVYSNADFTVNAG